MKYKRLLCKVVGWGWAGTRHCLYGCAVALFCIAIAFSGCTVTFTSSDTLQLNLLESTDKAAQLFSEFEASEEDSVAGDVTQKTGSVCAGGACIIY